MKKILKAISLFVVVFAFSVSVSNAQTSSNFSLSQIINALLKANMIPAQNIDLAKSIINSGEGYYSATSTNYSIFTNQPAQIIARVVSSSVDRIVSDYANSDGAHFAYNINLTAVNGDVYIPDGINWVGSNMKRNFEFGANVVVERDGKVIDLTDYNHTENYLFSMTNVEKIGNYWVIKEGHTARLNLNLYIDNLKQSGMYRISLVGFSYKGVRDTKLKMHNIYPGVHATQNVYLKSTAGSSSVACGPYTRDLTVGSNGRDVVNLQTFLTERGFLDFSTLPNGPVAFGYFGPLTQAALAQYQILREIAPAEGYFGSTTRATVARECGNQPPVQSSIKVLSPNGGEILEVDQTYKVKWDSNNVDKVDIYVDVYPPSVSYGSGNSNLLYDVNRVSSRNIPASQGYFDWKITKNSLPQYDTNTLSQNYRIRVTRTARYLGDTWADVSDRSDNYFTVVSNTNSNLITVTSPTEGTIYDDGPSEKIITKWTKYEGDFDYYRISLVGSSTRDILLSRRLNKKNTVYTINSNKVEVFMKRYWKISDLPALFKIEAIKKVKGKETVVAGGMSGSFLISDPNAQTFYADGIVVKLVGTPTAVVTSGAAANLEDSVEYTIKFEVTSFGDDAYISNATTTAYTYLYTGVEPVESAADLVGAGTKTGDSAGYYYKVSEGTSREFTYTVILTASSTGDATVSNLYMSDLGWGTTTATTDAYGGDLSDLRYSASKLIKDN